MQASVLQLSGVSMEIRISNYIKIYITVFIKWNFCWNHNLMFLTEEYCMLCLKKGIDTGNYLPSKHFISRTTHIFEKKELMLSDDEDMDEKKKKPLADEL